MDKFIINGGNKLTGEVKISGAKNAAVAIIPACLLCDETCVIGNLPNISDVNALLSIIEDLGAKVTRLDEYTIEVDPSGVNSYVVPYEMSKRMRASYYFLGAMLGRFSKAEVAPPGGCDFGVRPIDLHIKGFEALGAEVRVTNNMIDAKAERLIGNSVYLDQVSVGATVNIMLTAVKARGLTVIENAAKEPHIVDLANFLITMGADIRGAGTNVIKIRGVDYLGSTNYSIIPDQIEAGTYMAAVAATGGDVLVTNITPKHLESITAKLEDMGVTIEEFDEAVRVKATGIIKSCNIKTAPHPGFPTDMQPQAVTILSFANGTSFVEESVWDNRFRYVTELKKFGANIEIEGNRAIINGVKQLKGCSVEATDLRAGAAMVVAGLAASGVTEITSIKYIERGYENIIEKLTKLGADIKRIH
ncbi:MAG: UDP-N-acetylglucosamine 1-carboxyvinyltransferase [Acutalibacteraceae bacterium]|nr:UDP-N-acetylglucosamine 1-carboxyvinyltransferase [Acutalibacteraceae bacterium]